MYYLKNNDEYILITQNVSLFSYRDQYIKSLLKFFNTEEQEMIQALIDYRQKNESKKLTLPYKLVLKDSQATEFTHELFEQVKQDLAEFQKIHEFKLKVFRLLHNKLKTNKEALSFFKKEINANYWKDEELFTWFKAETPYTKKIVEAFNQATLIDTSETKQTINLNAFAIYVDYGNEAGFVSAHNHAYVEATTISNARLFESTTLAQQYINKKNIKNYSIVEVNLNIFSVVNSIGKESKGMNVIQSLIEKTLIEKNLLNEAENFKVEIERLTQIINDSNLSHLLEKPKVENTKKRKI
jgi:hypothetical protein